MLRLARLVCLLLCTALAACGTTQLPLPYTAPPGIAARGPASVAAVDAVDARGESVPDANWVGTIRGGFGNPLKRLETDRPLVDVVADAVRQALQARGLLGGPEAPYAVHVTIQQLESDQVARREAKVRLRFDWTRNRSSGVAFTTNGQADIVAGSLVTFEGGVFGSVDELRNVLSRAISQAIDQALDDPAVSTRLAARS